MTGNLFVKDTLALKEGCSVKGNLSIKRLIVELGARFDGNCKMLDDVDYDKLSGKIAEDKKVGGTPLQA